MLVFDHISTYYRQPRLRGRHVVNGADFSSSLQAGAFVFGNRGNREQILLSDNLLDQYSLGNVPKERIKPNSHLSLLAMVDCWYQLRMNPYSHMVCQTPLFRFWL